MPEPERTVTPRAQTCFEMTCFTLLGGLSAAGLAALGQCLEERHSASVAVVIGLSVLLAVDVTRRIVFGKQSDESSFRARHKVANASVEGIELGGFAGLLMGVNMPHLPPTYHGFIIGSGFPLLYLLPGPPKSRPEPRAFTSTASRARSRQCASALALFGGLSAMAWAALGQLLQAWYSPLVALVIGVAAFHATQVARWAIFRRRTTEWLAEARQSVAIACVAGIEMGSLFGPLMGFAMPEVSPVVLGTVFGIGWLLLYCSKEQPLAQPQLRA